MVELHDGAGFEGEGCTGGHDDRRRDFAEAVGGPCLAAGEGAAIDPTVEAEPGVVVGFDGGASAQRQTP